MSLSYPDQTVPGRDIVPIVPSDNTDLPQVARSIRCIGSGGTLRITTLAGNQRNTTIETNEVLEVFVVRVFATGTAATGLEAFT